MSALDDLLARLPRWAKGDVQRGPKGKDADFDQLAVDCAAELARLREDNHLLRVQCRVGDSAFQHLHDEATALRRKVAAAPDLLAALQELFTGSKPAAECAAQVRAAIAKAGGAK